MSADERRRPRVRLIEQPVKRQRINFAQLIKNAALAESEKAGKDAGCVFSRRV